MLEISKTEVVIIAGALLALMYLAAYAAERMRKRKAKIQHVKTAPGGYRENP